MRNDTAVTSRDVVKVKLVVFLACLDAVNLGLSCRRYKASARN